MNVQRISQWFNPYKNIRLYQNGWLILFSIILGLYVGHIHGSWLGFLTPFSHILSQSIKVWILPLLLARVILAMIKLIGQSIHKERNTLYQSVIVFLCFASVISIITLGISQILLKSDVALYNDPDLLNRLGNLLLETKINSALAISFNSSNEANKSGGMIDLIVNIIPDNIFSEFASNQTADVVFFGIIVGFFYGKIYANKQQKNPKYKDVFIDILEVICKGLVRSMAWFKILLPFLLVIQVANITDKLGGQVFLAMGNFIVSFVAIFFVILIISFLIIWIQSKQPIAVVITSLVNPIILTFFTRDSLNAIPFSTLALHTSLKFNKTEVNLITPFLMTLSRFGSVIYLIVATLFVTKLYSKPMDLLEIITVILMSMISAISTSGPQGIMGLLIPILTTLEMPPETALVLLGAVDPIIAPFREVITVFPNIAAITLIVNKETRITS